MIHNHVEWVRSNWLRSAIVGLGVVFVALLIFQAGIFVGYHKAQFGHRMGDGYERTFGAPATGMRGMMNNAFGPGFPDGHGAFGSVVSVAPGLLVVAAPDKTEKTVHVATSTEVRRFRDTISLSELHVGDIVTIFGEPAADGSIDARLVRLMPAPMQQTIIDSHR